MFQGIGRLASRMRLVKLLYLQTIAITVGSALLVGGCDRDTVLVREAQPETPLEEEGPLGVRIREIWRTNIDPRFGSVGGMAEWPDGSIWVADGRNVELWELRSDGSRPKTISWSADISNRIESIMHLSMAPGFGALIVGGSGEGVDVATVDKKFGHHVNLPLIWQYGFTGLSDGGFVVSGGKYPSQPFSQYSVHRYDRGGNHVASWHPVFEHKDWLATRRLSGGPVALTAMGDLLVSDVAPFRVTRYLGMDGDKPVLVVENEDIISSSELIRALAPEEPRVTFQFRWNRSIFVDEMPDGNILNVAHLYSSRRGRPEGLWTVVTPEGDLLASTRFSNGYDVWGRSQDGGYLADFNGFAVKLAVSVGPRDSDS